VSIPGVPPRGTPSRGGPSPSVPTGMNLAGAVDLSALATAKKSAEQASMALASAPPGVVIDVNELDFEELVIKRSLQVPVIVDLWAEWCGPCKQLSPALEKLTAEQNGRLILAKVDVDANQQLAAAFNVQSIPSVFLVIGGQVAPLFQGALPEAQLRQVFEKVLEVAAAQGITGYLNQDGEVEGESPLPEGVEGEAQLGDDVVNGSIAPGQGLAGTDPHLAAIQDALTKGDVGGAKQAAENLLVDRPGDPVATAVLAQVSLMSRAQELDPKKVQERALGLPDDPAAQMQMADLEFTSGQPAAAIHRLITLIKKLPADQRELVRLRLLELFDCMPPDDPDALKGRRDLASSLF
jgi:putative thioredoxin